MLQTLHEAHDWHTLMDTDHQDTAEGHASPATSPPLSSRCLRQLIALVLGPFLHGMAASRTRQRVGHAPLLKAPVSFRDFGPLLRLLRLKLFAGEAFMPVGVAPRHAGNGVHVSNKAAAARWCAPLGCIFGA